MFDGDGGIGIYKYKYTKKYSPVLNYTGNENVVSFVADRLNILTHKIDVGNGIFTVRSSSRDNCVRIGHFLYDDATIYMKRKKDIFEHLYQLYREGK